MKCPGRWCLLVYVLVLVWGTVLGQKVDLNFSTQKCISQNQRNNIHYSDTVDGAFPSGCTIAVRCQYHTCQSTESNLIITLGDTELDKVIVVNNSSSCGLEVFIYNVTLRFHKKEVECKNRDNPKLIQNRTIEVGYPPARPQNLSVEYQPNNFIHLWLDPVQSAQDLNDNNTNWSVEYFWRNSNHCQNFTTRNSSRHLACKIDLKGLKGTSKSVTFYPTSRGGSTTNMITFSVHVSNKFGHNSTSKKFSLVKFIRPDEVTPTLVAKGSSWLLMNVSVSSAMLEYCRFMNDSGIKPNFRVEYTVHGVSETDEQKLRPEREAFHKNFSFYRNLPDDEAAVENQRPAYYLNQARKWKCANKTMYINVTHLEPNSHYRISFCLLGKYRGPETTDTYRTSESKPVHAPKFGISPYYCFTGDQDTVSCVIYFQEIPRPLRHATVTNYTLKGLSVGEGCHKNRQGCKNFTERADGQDNSILVKNLTPGCVYKIRLTAETELGPSLPATQIVNASDIENLVDVEVVRDVENNITGHPVYTVYWNSASWAQVENISYYIHYCYTPNTETFKCMTNLVTQPANSGLSYSKIELTHYPGHMSRESPLRPTFFVSAVHNGNTSGMVKEKWRYCTDKAPTEVKSLVVVRSDSDPTHLKVQFRRADTDSSDCKGGRPTHFVISWRECSNGCHQKDYSKTLNSQTVNTYIKGPFTLTGLNQSTTYCVWVKAQGRDSNSSSVCESATTARSLEGNFVSIIVAGILIVVTIVIFLICVSSYFYCRNAKAKISRILVDWPKPNIKAEPFTRCAVPSSFQAFTKLSTGPGHVLSGDSGIDDEVVDAVYGRSLLTAHGEDKWGSEQPEIGFSPVQNHGRDCARQQFSWSSGSMQSQLHMEQEDEQVHKSRYHSDACAPSYRFDNCDEGEEDGDEEQESLIESEEEENLTESEETELSDSSSQRTRNSSSFLNCSSYDMATALAKLPKSLFQLSES